MSWAQMGAAKSQGGMGFRGFSCFNSALLGKQCWRLLMDESSLMARVFKGRYFPRTNITKASIGFQPSYAWRSIFSARDLVVNGSRWLLGNGLKTQIWNDNWLPEQVNFKVCSPVTQLAADATVSELIDVDTRQWNRSIVFSCFNKFEAQQIINIPISWRLPEDKRIWHWEKHGNYSVKSAYHMLMNDSKRNVPETSSSNSKKVWSAVWKIKAPNCVKNFIWRLCKDILPTRGRLERKGLNIDPICPLCSMEKETSSHLFMHCHLVKLLWFSSPLGFRVPPHSEMFDWIRQWLSVDNSLVKQIFCVTLWKIWKARNDLIFNSTVFNPIAIAASSVTFVEDFNDANSLDSSSAPIRPPACWESPSLGVVKMNIDAGCFADGKTGCGLIARDYAGSVLFAGTDLLNYCVSPLVAETMCLRWALNWAKDQNFEAIWVETDAQLVVKCLAGQSEDSSITNLVLDCKLLLDSMPNSRLSHASRTCNRAAHTLVGMAKSVGSVMWRGYVPEPCLSVTRKDASSSFSSQLIE